MVRTIIEPFDNARLLTRGPACRLSCLRGSLRVGKESSVLLEDTTRCPPLTVTFLGHQFFSCPHLTSRSPEKKLYVLLNNSNKNGSVVNCPFIDAYPEKNGQVII